MRAFCVCLTAAILALPFGLPARAEDPQYLSVSMHSDTLSAFWGQPVAIDAHVLLPDSYYKEPSKRYPVIYWIQGFDGHGDPNLEETLAWKWPMRAIHREFIIVFLDGMFNGGHQEFADSANNGPWGTALTTEFIPQTETHFRALNSPSARFVAGHSSGGWSALWLQITYPDLFGGEWSVSPDPVDFRNFMGVDLTAADPQNFYQSKWHDSWGEPLRQLANDPRWGRRQFESFNAVFSPRENGEPQQLFDPKTGVVDPSVAAYWDTHYDISSLMRENWSTLQTKLRGKVHIFVGTSDDFHLNDSVVLLQKELLALGSDAEVQVVPALNHWTIFEADGGLRGYIIREASSLSALR